jgi:hypothetical protein
MIYIHPCLHRQPFALARLQRDFSLRIRWRDKRQSATLIPNPRFDFELRDPSDYDRHGNALL